LSFLHSTQTDSGTNPIIIIIINGSTALVLDLGSYLRFLKAIHSRYDTMEEDQSIARPLSIQRTTQTRNKHKDIRASRVIRTHGSSV
jgi:hypothetical protein